MKELTIPSSVTFIGNSAFAHCGKLITLNVLNTIPPTVDSYPLDPFDSNQYTTIEVYVPQKALAAYQSADVWKNFQNLKAIVNNGIAIDEVNFPDENFRNYLLAQSYGEDALLTEDEIQGITRIDVSGRGISSLKGIEHFSMLTELLCYSNQLTTLDVTQNTMLKYLDCDENLLTALDVTRNTALTELYCGDNQLTSLDVTQNTLLTNLQCRDNPLTAIDVTQNTALIWFYCFNNQLTTLDVSRNTALKGLYCDENKLTVLNLSENTELMALDCFNNQLTALDLSKNTMLDYLDCSRNHIEGTSMDALISSLPQNTADKSYTFHVYDNSRADEGNVCTKSQVAAVKARGWVPYYYDSTEKNWSEYEGSEDEPTEPTSITLPEMETVNVNSTIQLTPTIEPADAVTDLTWSSDDESIAKVTSKGLVAGIKPGTAIISVRTSNNLIAECFVIVQDVSGIEDVNAGDGNNKTVYTISGQKATKPVKGGIYIINGKKVVMK